MSDKPALGKHSVVRLVETHGEYDEVVGEWPGNVIVVSRDKVQVDGAVVALYEDQHYYTTKDGRTPDPESLTDICGNQVWIEPPR